MNSTGDSVNLSRARNFFRYDVFINYMYNHKIVDFGKPIREDGNNYRYYKTPKGVQLPSITTLLSQTKPKQSQESLIQWEEREGDAAYHIIELSKIYGTGTHKAIEQTLNNELPDLSSGMVSFHYNNLLKYITKIDNIAGIEVALYSEKLSVAGTADCIAEFDKKLSIIDYKTKRKPQKAEWMTDYFIQGTAYAQMFTELTGLNIEQIVILVSVENGISQEFIESPIKYVNQLEERITQYNYLNKTN